MIVIHVASELIRSSYYKTHLHSKEEGLHLFGSQSKKQQVIIFTTST